MIGGYGISPRKNGGLGDENRVPTVPYRKSATRDGKPLLSPRALYRAARSGTNPLMTGVGDPYEPPLNAELVVNTAECTPDEAAASIRALLTNSRN